MPDFKRSLVYCKSLAYFANLFSLLLLGAYSQFSACAPWWDEMCVNVYKMCVCARVASPFAPPRQSTTAEIYSLIFKGCGAGIFNRMKSYQLKRSIRKTALERNRPRTLSLKLPRVNNTHKKNKLVVL